MTIVGVLAFFLLAVGIVRSGWDDGLHRERKIYQSVIARATQPILKAATRKGADALAACLSSNPTGRLRMTALSRGVRDEVQGVRYDRVVLHDAMALLGGITARADGGADLVMIGRPGRRLHDRERATIAACI